MDTAEPGLHDRVARRQKEKLGKLGQPVLKKPWARSCSPSSAISIHIHGSCCYYSINIIIYIDINIHININMDIHIHIHIHINIINININTNINININIKSQTLQITNITMYCNGFLFKTMKHNKNNYVLLWCS